MLGKGFTKSGTAQLLLTTVCILIPACAAGVFPCERDTGPAGVAGCLVHSLYTAPQYATCLTDAYIQQVSKGKHRCADRTRQYCYYQCMMEVHNKESMEVTPDCVCDPDSTPTLQNVTAYGPQCFSPNGSDCAWYSNCLEKRFDCKGSADNSAVTFAEKFCTMFLDKSDQLSIEGKRWMDQARKCLQVQLVPLLRPFEEVTCNDVKQRAVQSQAACYLKPFVDAPSMCDLPPADFWRVFWTVKGAFASQYKESLVGVLKVAKGCAPSQPGSPDEEPIRSVDGMTQISVGIPLNEQTIFSIHGHPRYKRSASIANAASSSSEVLLEADHGSNTAGKLEPSDDGGDEQADEPTSFVDPNALEARFQRIWSDKTKEVLGPAGKSHTSLRKHRVIRETSNTWEGETEEEMYYHDLAEATAAQMAEQLGWTERGITWFAYAKVAGNDTLLANILLADIQAFELENETTAVRPNLTEVVEQAAQAFEEGEIIISFNGTQVQVETFSACGDVGCDDVYLSITVPPAPSSTVPHSTGAPLNDSYPESAVPNATLTSRAATAGLSFQTTVGVVLLVSIAFGDVE